MKNSGGGKQPGAEVGAESQSTQEFALMEVVGKDGRVLASAHVPVSKALSAKWGAFPTIAARTPGDEEKSRGKQRTPRPENRGKPPVSE